MIREPGDSYLPLNIEPTFPLFEPADSNFPILEPADSNGPIIEPDSPTPSIEPDSPTPSIESADCYSPTPSIESDDCDSPTVYNFDFGVEGYVCNSPTPSLLESLLEMYAPVEPSSPMEPGYYTLCDSSSPSASDSELSLTVRTNGAIFLTLCIFYFFAAGRQPLPLPYPNLSEPRLQHPRCDHLCREPPCRR